MVLKRVLVVDDEENILLSIKGALEDEGFKVATASSGHQGVDRFKQFAPDVVLLDIWLPDEDGINVLEKIRKYDPLIEIIMMSGHGTIETAVTAIKKGAFDFLEKPIHFEKLLVLLKHVFELKELKNENRYLREELAEDEQLVSWSPATRKLSELISVTGPSNGWVVVQGEYGSGKELVARMLHMASERSHRRFVSINCAALEDGEVENELFGYEKGAFVGASERKMGKLEQADGGTLFLDQIEEASSLLQEQLLKVFHEERTRRKAAEQYTDLDLRVIASSSKSLEQYVRAGQFLPELYSRLNVIPIVVPPLRERREDISQLVAKFLGRYSNGKTKRITEAGIRFLSEHSWPGNVRELKNWVERACLLSRSEVLDIEDLWGVRESNDPFRYGTKTLRKARSEFEKDFIERMLSENQGNVSRTAQSIGLERSYLHKKIRSYGIEVKGSDVSRVI